LNLLSPLRSELKLKILLSLLKEEKKISQLKVEVETRDTTILHVLGEFVEQGLITKSQAIYKLSSIGLMEARILQDYVRSIEVLEKFKSFWITHNVSDIPTVLLLKISALRNSVLIQTEASNLGLVRKTFFETIQASKTIRGISPIFDAEFISFFSQLLDRGNIIELIVSKAVLNSILELVDPQLIKKYLEASNLKIFVNENVKLSLAVTENSFSLGLFSLSGEYDDKMDLVSSSREAIEWGEQLFEEVLKSSDKLGL
jgi:predicted transcriptional regulator